MVPFHLRTEKGGLKWPVRTYHVQYNRLPVRYLLSLSENI